MSHKWDDRHRGQTPGEPNPRLVGLAARLPTSGRAIDVACGRGGDALFLAARGLRVDAVDRSRVALSIVAGEAAERGVSERVTPIQVELEREVPFGGQAAYDLVVCVSYLHRPLLPMLAGLLRPGGLLFFDTFHRGYLEIRPTFSVEWLLADGEPAGMFPDFDALETWRDDSRASALLRKARAD